jgi:hypothetical protein
LRVLSGSVSTERSTFWAVEGTAKRRNDGETLSAELREGTSSQAVRKQMAPENPKRLQWPCRPSWWVNPDTGKINLACA